MFVVLKIINNTPWQIVRWNHIKRAELYQKCFNILGLSVDSDQDTVRRAYIDLVKKLHPDSGEPEASAERFQIVDEAFKVLQEKFAKNRRGIYDDEEEKEFDIEHTAPQHRQYLSFDGLGVGNPFQRQKQYQQVKAMKAQDRVLNHRLEKSQADEKTLMKKPAGGFYKKHAIKTKYGFDRVVEDLIQEAMSKGDFDNLRGIGKPLTTAQTQNPYLDFTTNKLNQILQDNGFTPEWIMLQRDIREGIRDLNQKLRKERAVFGDYPFATQKEANDWSLVLKRFECSIQQMNKMIDKYNLIVPMFDKQFFRLKIEKLSNEILNDPNAVRNLKPPTEAEAIRSSSTKPTSHLLSFIGSLF